MLTKKVKYIIDSQVAVDGVTVVKWILPQCPTCKNAPTYNMDICPFCGQELEYPADVIVEIEND
jgi:rRNA maturation endonuclease Nob1